MVDAERFKILGDALHGRAAGQPDEHLEFPLRQALDRRFRAAVEFRQRQLLGERGVDVAAARGDGRHRFEQCFGGAALGQEAQRAFLQCAARMHGVIVRRQGQHLRLGVVGANPAQRLEAAHARHREIHHHDVGLELEIELACGFAGFRLGDHRHFRHGLQQQPKSHAHHGVIVDQQDADHAWTLKGMSAVRRTPRPS